MTRHWLEAYVDQDCVSFNLICEHPKACMETGKEWRDSPICAVQEFFGEYRTELLDFPATRKDVIGRIEVAAQWTGGGEDSDLRLTPTDPLGHEWSYPYDAHPGAAECNRCGAHDDSVPCGGPSVGRMSDDDRLMSVSDKDRDVLDVINDAFDEWAADDNIGEAKVYSAEAIRGALIAHGWGPRPTVTKEDLVDHVARIEAINAPVVNGGITLNAESMADALIPFLRECGIEVSGD